MKNRVYQQIVTAAALAQDRVLEAVRVRVQEAAVAQAQDADRVADAVLVVVQVVPNDIEKYLPLNEGDFKRVSVKGFKKELNKAKGHCGNYTIEVSGNAEISIARYAKYDEDGNKISERWSGCAFFAFSGKGYSNKIDNVTYNTDGFGTVYDDFGFSHTSGTYTNSKSISTRTWTSATGKSSIGNIRVQINVSAVLSGDTVNEFASIARIDSVSLDVW